MSTFPGLVRTPEPPYYAVIFTSRRTAGDQGYDAMAGRMVELGSGHEGFLGIESVRGADGRGITVSYWRDEAAILAWKREHRAPAGPARRTRDVVRGLRGEDRPRRARLRLPAPGVKASSSRGICNVLRYKFHFVPGGGVFSRL